MVAIIFYAQSIHKMWITGIESERLYPSFFYKQQKTKKIFQVFFISDKFCLSLMKFKQRMEDVLEKQVQHKENPFKVGIVEYVLLIGDQNKVNQLSDQGRLVLKYVPHKLNRFSAVTQLDVRNICIAEFKSYDETLATRVRRGIRNLVAEKVIAYTTKKNYYWVNKSVIWI